jgi:iron-sulfur cluster repair protein YtfE (RIC family)
VADFDIDVLVLGEHEVFRRSFTQIEALEDPAQLAQRWQELADGLEVHASAEETIFYPELLQSVEHAQDDTEHAVHDHNEIRDAVRGVDTHPVGADQWWAAFRQAREVTADHLDEEEREMLPAFRDGVGADKRHELGMRWLEFHEQHDRAKGLSGQTKDPEAYVTEHA